MTRTERRLRDLQEIARLFAGFEGLRPTLSRVLDVVAGTLRLRTAIVIDTGAEDGGLHLVSWRGKRAGEADAASASMRARTFFQWLGNVGADPSYSEEAVERPIPDGADGDSTVRFLVLPLTVEGRGIFGLIQLECEGQLAETDVVFVNALASQLAIALDRERIRRADLVSRAALREQLDFTGAVAASLGEAIVAVNADGKIRLLNEAAETLLDCEAAQAVGLPLSSIVSIVSPTGPLADPLGSSMRTGRRFESASHSLVRADGAVIPVSFTCTPVRSAGNSIGAVIAFQDIRERKRAEATQAFLLDASHRLGASLDFRVGLATLCDVAVPSLGDFAFMDILLEGRVERAAWKHRTSEGQEALDRLYAGAPLLDVRTHPAQRALVRGQVIIRQKMTDADSDFLAIGGPEVEFRSLGVRSLVTVPLGAGHSRIGALTVCFASTRRHDPHDVVLLKELARSAAFSLENGRAYAGATRAVALREQVLAVVSHDLRSPLGVVMLSAEIIAATIPRNLGAERARRAATRVGHAAQRMSRLIEDLLDFASIESGKFRIERLPVDPAALVAEAAAFYEEDAREARVHLRVTHAPGVATVSCDRGRILQVLSNLVSNALKLSKTGGSITLDVCVRESAVLFSVKDTGPGLAPRDRERIFERYWRGDARYRGSGLGLGIARGIVEAHGGRIWVESVLGEGATFFFTLPPPRVEKRGEDTGEMDTRSPLDSGASATTFEE